MSKISINHTRPVLFCSALFIISVFPCLYKFLMRLNTFMYRCVEKDWKQVWYAVHVFILLSCCLFVLEHFQYSIYLFFCKHRLEILVKSS